MQCIREDSHKRVWFSVHHHLKIDKPPGRWPLLSLWHRGADPTPKTQNSLSLIGHL